MTSFPLPCLTLNNKAWSCDIADPRDNVLALGARFIHGGYISRLSLNDRDLSTRAIDHWDAYYGQGLPEAFDEPLGFAAAQDGESYLRIGSGKCVRHGPLRHNQTELTEGVRWALSEQSATHCIWTCSDELDIGGEHYAYRFERRVTLTETGLQSSSSLRLHCPWSEPLSWFPHPYFRQLRGSANSVHLPEHCLVNNHFAGKQLWQGEDNATSFAVITGLWAQQQGIIVDLDQELGGGSMAMTLDRPLDKMVCWSNQRSFAAEPYWSHAWSNGEQTQWTLTYTYSPASLSD